MWTMENDVIRLPLARWPSRVDERRVLAVNGAGLPVGIGVVLVRIEHLEFVDPHQEDATIPALLPFALGRRWCGPLDVQLHVAESTTRDQHPRAWVHFYVAVSDDPFRSRAVFSLPLSEAIAIKQHDRVGRRRCRRCLRSWLHDPRPRPLHRVLRPLLRLYHDQQS